MAYFRIMGISATKSMYGINENMKEMIGKIINIREPTHPDDSFTYGGWSWMYKDLIQLDKIDESFKDIKKESYMFDPTNLINGEHNEGRT